MAAGIEHITDRKPQKKNVLQFIGRTAQLEHLHLNSFMYEPLIDMSVWHLIELYGKVKELLEA